MTNGIQHAASAAGYPRIRLIATDIDGTLLDSDSQLPPLNRAVLEAALKANVRLALVTARKQSSTFAVAELLSLPCACIAHNGARIWDWQGHELQHLVVDLELAREVARFAERTAIPLIMTVNEVNYYSSSYPGRIPDELPGEQRVRGMEQVLDTAPTRIIVTGTAGVDAICSAFGDAPDSVVLHRYYSREGSMASAVLTHPRANKSDALAVLVGGIGVQPTEVLALGDAEADAGMLAWAGVGVAMGNAMPQARAAAQWIAPSHDEAGFAVAVRKFVLADLEATHSQPSLA